MRNVHALLGNVADRLTSAGPGLSSQRMFFSVSDKLAASQQTASRSLNEQDLLTALAQSYRQVGLNIPTSLIITYYVALKSGVFVTLVGKPGIGKIDFAQTFAHALVGDEQSQYTVIPTSMDWLRSTGEGSYYRSVFDRFAAMRFLEVLHEAALPTNAQKLFFVFFQRLQPELIEHFLARVIAIDAQGTRRLRLSGAPVEQQPVIPSNLCMTATVDTPHNISMLNQPGLNHAALLSFSPLYEQPALLSSMPPPLPVGYQRIWTQSLVSSQEAARQRLASILGVDGYARLQASPTLQSAFWSSGTTLYERHRKELTLMLANSFDSHGQGLFHPNAQRNAQIAYDAYIIQRVLWQLQESHSPATYDLMSYIESQVAGARALGGR